MILKHMAWLSLLSRVLAKYKKEKEKNPTIDIILCNKQRRFNSALFTSNNVPDALFVLRGITSKLYNHLLFTLKKEYTYD